MKAFFTWLILFLAIFAGISIFAHITLSAQPINVLIAIDESYRMQSVDRKVQTFIKEQKNRRYTRFAIITNRRADAVHSWQGKPQLQDFKAFGSWNLAKLLDASAFPEINKADEIYILTNARDTSSLGTLPGKAKLVALTPLAD